MAYLVTGGTKCVADLGRALLETEAVVCRDAQKRPEKNGHGGKPSGKRTKKARRSLRGRPLTDKQREVVDKVTECKGNKSEAARQLAIDPSTVRQQFNAGMEKLGRMASKLIAPRRTSEPAKLEMGAQDGRTARQRAKREAGEDE